MKNTIREKSFLLLFALAMLLWQVPKVNAQVTYIGEMQSADLVVCDPDSEVPLEFVKFKLDQSSSDPITVSVKLADGVEYAQGLNVISSGIDINVTETDVTNPIFKITKTDGSAFASGETIEFTFNRKADCTAYNNAITSTATGFEFKDVVTVTINGTDKVKESNTYNVAYPNFVLTSPTSQNNKNLGDNIERTFTLENGGVTSTKKAYITVDYGDAVYFANPGKATLEVDAGNGFVTLNPSSVVGGKATYILTGSQLGTTGELENGESIILREKFKLKTCDLETNYTAGWGCDADNLCQVINKQSIITMEAGAANFDNVVEIREDFVSRCQPFKLKLQYTNSGSGGKAGAMYDVSLKLIAQDPASSQFHAFSDFKINGVPVSNSSENWQIAIATGGQLNSDPDGAGVGLEDLDGDGFYDDLPVGAMVELEITVIIKQDLPSCGEYIRNIYKPSVEFHTACNLDNIEILGTSNLKKIGNYRGNLADSSYTPANIQAGETFSGILAFSYGLFYDAYSLDGRWVYEITLPLGMTLSNVQWVRGFYPSTYSPEAPAEIITNGNVIKVVSPDKNSGYVTFDAVYNCQTDNSDVQIDYKVNHIADYTGHPECVSLGANGICSTKNFLVVGCEQNCTSGGPLTGIPVVERLDNSLGWTDVTMAQIQDRVNISKYDLAKSMYKDEFKVETTATQNGVAHNIGAKLVVAKDKDENDGLEGISADVIITRGGAEVGQAMGITTYTLDNSTDTHHIFDWDLTEAIPTGGLLDGDKIKITTKYRVISENYPLVDENAGKTWTVYNSDSPLGTPVWEGVVKSCSSLIPEIYIMGTSIINGTNGWSVNSCNSKDLGGDLAYIARRFGTGAIKYQDEYRPSLKLNVVYLEIPKSLTLNEVEYIRTKPETTEYLSPTSTTDMGDYWLFKYEIPDYLGAVETTVTNAYGAKLRVNVSPTCALSEDPNHRPVAKVYFDYTDYYYYAKKQATIPAELNFNKGLIAEQGITYTKKPSVNMVNQTGNVQLSGQDGEWIVRFTNPSQSTAPYTWMALPDVADLIITEVVRVSDGQVIAPIAYTGGNMYQLSTDGVTSGGSEDYKVKFSYTGCAPISLEAKGGWNCSSFPNTPNEYICNANVVALSGTPLKSLLEVSQVSVPSMNPRPELCTELEYVYQLQSSDEANLYNPKFKIAPATGLAITGEVKVEYPAGSGTWHTITPTPVLSGGEYVIDVMQHPALAALGYLKGVEESNGNNSLRQINIKFKTTTDCDFTSGKNFKLRGEAYNACGVLVNGSNVPKSTPAILIEGADAPYLFISTVVIENPAPSNTVCQSTRKISITETVDAASGVVTGANGKFEFTLPYGYDYESGSFVGGSNAPEISSLAETTLPTGEKVITFDVPAGLGDGAVVEFNFNIVESTSTPPVCGQLTLEFNAIDQIAGLSCGGTTCNNFSVVTGGAILNFELKKPELTLSVVSASSTYNSGENLNVEFNLENTSTEILPTGTIVTLFDDKDNNGEFSNGDAVVGTHTTTADVNANSTYNGIVTVTGANINDLCNLMLTVRSGQGCFCSVLPASLIINEVDGLAGQDIQACKDEATDLGVALTGYTTYEWSSTDAGAMAYLSSTNTAQTQFTYTGPAVTTPTTFTYTLTVTRPGGCTVTDVVEVTVNDCGCLKDPNTAGGSGLPTNHGITTLQRAGVGNGNWPMVRKGAWTALEAKTKGFVITRVDGIAQDAPGNPGQVTSITNPKEGMMVYDIVNKCLKIYNGTKWSCFTKPGCPQ